VFLGFPLHQANQPSDSRVEHLFGIRVRMLFLPGTRDKLADMSLLVPLVERLGPNATLVSVDGADHSFHCPAKSGRTDPQVLDEVLDALAGWVDDVLSPRAPRISQAEPRYPNAALQRQPVL
jgi:hypothetical protein